MQTTAGWAGPLAGFPRPSAEETSTVPHTNQYRELRQPKASEPVSSQAGVLPWNVLV